MPYFNRVTLVHLCNCRSGGCVRLRGSSINMKDFNSNEEFLAVLRTLIEKWCDERRLDALAQILPAYLAFNGLADGWGELSNPAFAG